MSIFHCSIKIISRSGGRSAVASAAYRSGENLYNEETGLHHDYTHKGGVVMSEILLPDNAPERFSDRELLWNEVQRVEKRADAQLAREVEVAFPVEMNRDQQVECARKYINDNFVSKGMVADWALHDKGDGNPHAHILLTVRGLDENREWRQKQRSVFANARDEIGRAIFDPSLPQYDPKDKEHTSQYRIPALDKNGNQKTRVRKGKGTEYLWEKISIPENDWNDHARAEEWRKSWADHCNYYLDAEKHIDHRSYMRQGLDIEPSIHEGITARQMENEGKPSDRREMNREIQDRNSIRQELARIMEEIIKTIIEKARELYERFTGLGRADGYSDEAGRSDLNDGITAEQYRTSEEQASGSHSGELPASGGTGRIHELERELEQRKPQNDETDRRIEETEQEIVRKGASNDERIRKLMERRRASESNGGDAGSDRVSTVKERRADLLGREYTSGATGIETEILIRDLQASIRDATSAEEDSGAKREDREAEQRRLDTQRQRAAKAAYFRSRSDGYER